MTADSGWCRGQTEPSLDISGKMKELVGEGDCSLLVTDIHGKPLLELDPEEKLIPASTLKIATAGLVLRKLHEDFRFETKFFLDDSGILTVVASGDPFLVSEEWKVIADSIAARVSRLKGISLDPGLFDENTVIPGTGETHNPYDAGFDPFCTNFNTCMIKIENGRVESAEPQTPLTDTARKIAVTYGKNGTFRLPLRNRDEIRSYTVEIFRAFLESDGVIVEN